MPGLGPDRLMIFNVDRLLRGQLIRSGRSGPERIAFPAAAQVTRAGGWQNADRFLRSCYLPVSGRLRDG
jgi:hypothetical protein